MEFLSAPLRGGVAAPRTLVWRELARAYPELVPPDPDKIEQYGHLVIQALVAIVTIWATVRKALQKPETES